MNPRCSIDNAECSAPGGKIRRGMCLTHYERQWHHGDPHAYYTHDPRPHVAGELSGTHKLTAAQVAEIRALRKEDPQLWTYDRLAERFPVGRTSIAAIITRKTWRHLFDGPEEDPAVTHPEAALRRPPGSTSLRLEAGDTMTASL